MAYSKTLSLALGMALAATSMPLDAKSPTMTIRGYSIEHDTTRVSFADLDLASRRGKATLIHRVNLAISSVCKPISPGNGTYLFSDTLCEENALNGANPQIDNAVRRARGMATKGASSPSAEAISLVFAQ